MTALAIFIGGGLGAITRWAIGVGSKAVWPGAALPVGTLIVNVAGCFALGLLSERFALGAGLSAPLRAGLTTGFLGGLTTFSTFGNESARLWSQSPGWAATNIALNVGVGLAAAVAGTVVARA